MSWLRTVSLLLLCACGRTFAGEGTHPTAAHATEPEIHLTFLWLTTQLVPSPQWSLLNHDGARFGMRWQATPVLYSFGINRKLSPWRWFIVEPYVRQSGSIELFCSPEYVNLSSVGSSSWLLRTGLRGYLPLWQHGEYLSVSGAASFATMSAARGIGYEAGIYAFAGIVGVQTTYTPVFTDARWTFTIRLRYF